SSVSSGSSISIAPSSRNSLYSPPVSSGVFTASNDVYGGITVNLAHMAPSEREIIETQVIKALISSYFNIVKRTIADMVPKAIMGFLVNYAKGHLQERLIAELYHVDLFEWLGEEGEEISEKRRACIELLGVLERAMEIVNQAREYS